MSEAVYKRITDYFIEKMKQGVIPWQQRWNTTSAKSLETGKPYQGVNALLLNSAGYKCEWWGTHRVITERGGYVRKGEKSIPVLRVVTKQPETDEDGNVTRKGYTKVFYYPVFNMEQTEGVEYPPTNERAVLEPLAAADTLLAGVPDITVKHGGNQAAYSPYHDTIYMPDMGRFMTAEDYYQTRFHETIHATGHPKRLGREQIVKMLENPHASTFGSMSYSYEELIAEIGATMLCAKCGIETTYDNSAAYVASWLQKFNSDPHFIITSASAAQKAVDYIVREVPEEEAA